MLLAFYFLLMRPQQKREAKRRELINSAKRDDRVLTSSGIVGRIHKVLNEKEISLEISDGVRIRILKTAVSEILEVGAGAIDLDDETEVSKKSAEKSGKNVKTAVEIPVAKKKIGPKRKSKK